MNANRTILRFLAPALLATAAVAGPAPQLTSSDAARASLPHYNLDDGLALDGYDPVAYFAEGGGKPREGKSSFSAKRAGVTYRFSSEANKERFLANPTRYEPAYGGWCAFAMTGGDKVEVDPESFLIDDRGLLVFYKGLFTETRKSWKKEGSEELRPKADGHWTKISGEPGPRDVSHFNLDDGLALAGHDPVAYADAKVREGKENFRAVHGGVEYRFASEEARTAFLAAPEKHEPRFGGWCAWAMSQGKKVEVDPEAYVRDKDGLFLFYNKDKRNEWLADRVSMQKNGETAWSKILQ